jgi:hypothetical protein
MQSTRFGQICPVCAGPFVSGEGGAGCVLCGYAIEQKRPVRLRRPAARSAALARRPRQLRLPLSAA